MYVLVLCDIPSVLIIIASLLRYISSQITEGHMIVDLGLDLVCNRYVRIIYSDIYSVLVSARTCPSTIMDVMKPSRCHEVLMEMSVSWHAIGSFQVD